MHLIDGNVTDLGNRLAQRTVKIQIRTPTLLNPYTAEDNRHSPRPLRRLIIDELDWEQTRRCHPDNPPRRTMGACG